MGQAVGSRATVDLKWGLVILPSPFLWAIIYSNSADVPSTPGDQDAAFRQSLLQDPNHVADPFHNGVSRFTPEHPLPMYKRAGYLTFEDFMDGYTWKFTKVETKSGKFLLNIRGERSYYLLLVPITDPNPGPDPSKSTLLFNFFPNEGSPHRAVIKLRQDDERIYAVL